MISLKVKIITITLLVCLGYFVINVFIIIIGALFQNPTSLLSINSVWSLIAIILIVSVWAYSTIKILDSIYNHIRFGSVLEQKFRKLDKEMKYTETFLRIAENEFLKRRISKQTFEDIQRIAGKKMVGIKAKKKEIAGPEKGKPE